MSHLLEYIDINEFKCFKNFHAEGFKRVNLISGKNNVGKTAFIEACWINLHSKNINSFLFALENINFARNNLEYIQSGYSKEDMIKNIEKNNFHVNSNINKTIFYVNDEKGVKSYEFTINDLNEKININKFSYSSDWIKNTIHIDNFGLTNGNLKDIFESVQKKDKENTLYKYINNFDSSIENFKIIGGDKPQCKVINGDYRDINEFGDGLKHYISIICSLYACENGYLFIDEIDNGIHYTQLDKLWEIILTISKEQNVQIFATTHAKEMIESYARVSTKLEDEDISFIKMTRLDDGSLKAGVRDYDMIQDSMEENHEVRGW